MIARRYLLLGGIALLLLLAGCAWLHWREARRQALQTEFEDGMLSIMGGRVDEGMSQIRSAARGGCAEAQVYMGDAHTEGLGVPVNEADAFKWFQLAADQKFPAGEGALGMAYFVGAGTAKDYGRGVALMRKGAEKGDARSQYGIAVACLGGVGVSQNVAEGIHYLRLSAAQNFPQAQFALGMALSVGNGVPVNHEEALAWYRKAAGGGGLLDAKLEVGLSLFEGRGVPADKGQAYRWFLECAQLGHPYAQEIVGLQLLTGDGVAQDKTEAVGWLNKAASKGRIAARRALYEIEHPGQEIPLSLLLKDVPISLAPN